MSGYLAATVHHDGTFTISCPDCAWSQRAIFGPQIRHLSDSHRVECGGRS